MGFQKFEVSPAHAVCHGRLSKMEPDSFGIEEEHLGSSQSSLVAGPFAPTPSLPLLILQSSTVQPCGDENPEAESLSLDISKSPRCISPDISTLRRLAPCRYIQPNVGLERAEVDNCLRKPSPCQVPTTYNPTKVPFSDWGLVGVEKRLA